MDALTPFKEKVENKNMRVMYDKIVHAAERGDLKYIRRHEKTVREFLLKCRRAEEYDDGGLAYYAGKWRGGRDMLRALYDAGGDFDETALFGVIDGVNLDALAFLAELAQRGDWAARLIPFEDIDDVIDLGVETGCLSQEDVDALVLWTKENKSLLDSTQCSTSGN